MRLRDLLYLALLLMACAPDADEVTTQVTTTRILALRGIPAEARPNTPVRYEALVADPDAPPAAEATFSYCTEARSAEERTGVSHRCLQGEALLEVGTVVPPNACALFGPNTPPSAEGEPARRPSDPDPSGGYFIPVLAEDDAGAAQAIFGFQRIRCDLAGATRDVFEQYQARYRENRHPDISLLQAGGEDLIAGRLHTLFATPTTLHLEVRADSFEPFVVYSANDSALYDQTEELHVHWYASAGEFSASEGLVDKNSRSASVQWTGPEPGERARLWIIVRDSRGGSVWADYEVMSAPTTP